MSKRREPRPRGGDSTLEVLRGKNRELQKTVRQLQDRVRQLENLIQLSDTGPKEPSTVRQVEKVVICDNCGKGEMIKSSIEKPGGHIQTLTCKICKHWKKNK